MRKTLATIALALTAALAGAGITHADDSTPPDAPTTTVSCLVDTCKPPVAVPAPADHPDTLPPFQRPPDRGVIVPDPNVGAVQTTVPATPARVRQATPAPARLPTTGGTSMSIVFAAAATLIAGLLAAYAARHGRAPHHPATGER